MISLSPEYLEIVKTIIKQHIPEYEVRVFGSRITNSYRKYSDLDLIVMGDDDPDDSVIFSLKEAFQNSDLPVRVEIIFWNRISDSFKNSIKEKWEILHKPA